MSNFERMAKMAGAARGLKQSVTDFNTLQASKQKAQQQKSDFDIDMKIKNLTLDKLESENKLAPERLKFEREKLKLQDKALKNEADLANVTIRAKEQELKTTAASSATTIAFLEKISTGEPLNLPSGAKISSKMGDLTVSFDGSDNQKEDLLKYIKLLGDTKAVSPTEQREMAQQVMSSEGVRDDMFAGFKDTEPVQMSGDAQMTQTGVVQAQPVIDQPADIPSPQAQGEFVKTQFTTDPFGFEKTATFTSPAAERKLKMELGREEVKKQISAQRGQLAEKQETNVDTAFLLVEQQAELLANAFKETEDQLPILKQFGIDPREGGLKGRFFGLMTKVLGKAGYNRFAKTFSGNLNEVAIAIAKIAAPSAKVGPDLIKVVQETLADLDGNIPEAISQLVVSGGTAYRNWVARAVDEETGERLFPTREEQITEARKFDNEIRTVIESAFEANGLLKKDNIREQPEENQDIGSIFDTIYADVTGGN